MTTNFIRKVFFYEDHYLNFYKTLKPEVQKKFNWTIQLVSTMEMIPKKYFKYLVNTSGIFEIRVEVGSDIYRVMSFFDEGNMIILINGFQKKTKKTPTNELALAEKLKKQYFDEKAK